MDGLGGVGGNTRPGAHRCLCIFCALAAFEGACACVTGIPASGAGYRLCASAIAQINGQNRVTFPFRRQKLPRRKRSHSPCVMFRFVIPTSRLMRSMPPLIGNNPGEHVAILGRTGCGKSTLLQLLTRASTRNKAKCLPLTIFRYPRWQPAFTPDYRVAAACPPVQRHAVRYLLLAAPNASDEALPTCCVASVSSKNLLEDSGLNSWSGEARSPAIRRRTSSPGHRPRAVA